MKLGYTEFSFGYAFTENLIRAAAARPAGAPVFPNLVQEAQLGYDVHIDLPGCPLFFQYKLPELMVRNSAAEISQHALAGIHVPFFRMPLMRRDLSDQHRLLIRLERRFPNAVFYATPGMANNHSFNAAYNAARVHQRSVFFSPRNIGRLPDDKQHVIAYRNGLSHAWLCSDPRKISAFHFESIGEKVRTLFDDQRFLTLEEASKNIRDEVLRLASPEIRAAEDAIRQRIDTRSAAVLDRPDMDARKRKVLEELLVSREIARVGLGMDMIIAQPAA